jgi:hypothetical protein
MARVELKGLGLSPFVDLNGNVRAGVTFTTTATVYAADTGGTTLTGGQLVSNVYGEPPGWVEADGVTRTLTASGRPAVSFIAGGPPGPTGPAGPPGSISNAVVVTDEKVWLTDPAFTNVADPTGVADSWAAFREAIDLAEAVLPGYGRPVISGEAGEYKILVTATQEHLFMSRGVGFSSTSRGGGMRFRFPNDTGAATLASSANTIAAAQASIAYSGLTGSAFRAASGGNPQTVCAGGLALFTYTGVTVADATSGTLTGCVGAPAMDGVGSGYPYSLSQGHAMHFAGTPVLPYTVLDEGIEVVGPGGGSLAAWGSPTPPNVSDGIYLGGDLRINCGVSSFRYACVFTTDHQRFGPGFQPNDCYANIYAGSPRQSLGDQILEAGADINGGYWANVVVGPDTMLDGFMCVGKAHFGSAPWVFWKQGNPASQPAILNAPQFNMPSFEGYGLGLIGCEDGLGLVQDAVFINALAAFGPSHIPPAMAEVAQFHCKVGGMRCIGTQGMFANSTPSNVPIFKTNYLDDCDFDSFENVIVRAAAGATGPIHAAVAAGDLSCNDVSFQRKRGEGRLYRALGAITKGDVVGFRTGALVADVSVETAQFTNQLIAGVALAAATAGGIVPVATQGPVTDNVAPGAPGASIPGGGVTLVRLNNAAPGKATAASSWGDTNGQVFAHAFYSADDGTSAVVDLVPR